MEVNFIHPKMSDRDLEIFGFMDAPNCFHIENNWTLAHVMHVAGVFPSVSIARKNGWNRSIPHGMSQFTVGKSRLSVCILNEFDNQNWS